MRTYVVTVVTSESSTTGDGPPQQDGGDIGASVIDNLPAGVSSQCKFDYACKYYVQLCVDVHA